MWKLNMNISEINWHDSVIERVVEDTDSDIIRFEVDYPVDWDNQKWEKRTIYFTDALYYEVHEGPFAGCPTILDVGIIGEKDARKIVRIETNAGYRQLAFKNLRLK